MRNRLEQNKTKQDMLLCSVLKLVNSSKSDPNLVW